MCRRLSILLAGLAAAALVAGCRQAADSPPKADTPAGSAGEASYRLAVEPAGAKPVGQLRKETKDNDEVTLIGRVGGEEKPFFEGMAAFYVVDPQLTPCEDGCKTPWDYCCATELGSARAVVRVVGPEGRPVPADARTLLGLKELSTVVVHGRAKRDPKGGLAVLADGVYVRP